MRRRPGPGRARRRRPPRPGCATSTGSADASSTSSGCWIYAGSYADEVNQAARIQEVCRGGGTLVSKEIVERLDPAAASAIGIDPAAVEQIVLAAATEAGLVIVGQRHADKVARTSIVLVAKEPYRAFAKVAAALFPASMRPQPVFANGQQRGYRVYPGRNRAQFNRLGLLPGDMVTAINGTPLDDASRGMEILQTMNTASSVNMTVERNGESVQVNVNNAQLAADAAAAAAMPEAIPVVEEPAEPSGSAE